MAERSLRTRLKDSSGRSYSEALAWGARWESLRSQWFSTFGMWDRVDDAPARLAFIEQEYKFETGESLHG